VPPAKKYFVIQSLAPLHLKVVRVVEERENVHKEAPGVGLEPGDDLGEQRLVVLHVLEHLDRDDAVEQRHAAAVDGAQVERVDVGREDGDVAVALGGGGGVDVRLLRAAVGEREDARLAG
jgi:hypothetical protein